MYRTQVSPSSALVRLSCFCSDYVDYGTDYNDEYSDRESDYEEEDPVGETDYDDEDYSDWELDLKEHPDRETDYSEEYSDRETGYKEEYSDRETEKHLDNKERLDSTISQYLSPHNPYSHHLGRGHNMLYSFIYTDY